MQPAKGLLAHDSSTYDFRLMRQNRRRFGDALCEATVLTIAVLLIAVLLIAARRPAVRQPLARNDVCMYKPARRRGPLVSRKDPTPNAQRIHTSMRQCINANGPDLNRICVGIGVHQVVEGRRVVEFNLHHPSFAVAVVVDGFRGDLELLIERNQGACDRHV